MLLTLTRSKTTQELCICVQFEAKKYTLFLTDGPFHLHSWTFQYLTKLPYLYLGCCCILSSLAYGTMHSRQVICSPTRPLWAELVIELPCPSGCVSAPSGAVFNRPGVAGAVLQSPPLLTHSSPFSLICAIYIFVFIQQKKIKKIKNK